MIFGPTLMSMSTHPLPRLISTTTASAAATAYFHLLQCHSSHPNLERSFSLSSSKSTTPLTLAILTSVLHLSSSLPDPIPALRFFVWAGLQPRFHLSTTAYSSAASSLHFSRHPATLHLLLDSYQSSDTPVSLKTFKILLSLCRHASLPSLSLSLLRRMPQFDCRPDTSCYNAVLRLLTSSGDSDETNVAVSLMDEMVVSGLRPDNVTYVSMVRGLCGSGCLADARELVVNQMRAHGCVPNVVVYSALLDGACESGDMDAAMEILDMMEGGGDQACRPNVVSYTCLMKWLCEKGRLEEALVILDRMGRRECRPNWVTVSTLLKGFCAEGRVDGAYLLIEKVVGEGSVSTEDCYSLLVVCLLRIGDRDGAKGLVRRMLTRDVRADGLACNSLMLKLSSERQYLDGYYLFSELEEEGLACITSDVYSQLLSGLCEDGHLVEATMLGRKIVEKGICIARNSVDRVVEKLNKFGEVDLASEIAKLKEP